MGWCGLVRFVVWFDVFDLFCVCLCVLVMLYCLCLCLCGVWLLRVVVFVVDVVVVFVCEMIRSFVLLLGLW